MEPTKNDKKSEKQRINEAFEKAGCKKYTAGIAGSHRWRCYIRSKSTDDVLGVAEGENEMDSIRNAVKMLGTVEVPLSLDDANNEIARLRRELAERDKQTSKEAETEQESNTEPDSPSMADLEEMLRKEDIKFDGRWGRDRLLTLASEHGLLTNA